jgi:hypothetical protein
MENGTIPGRRNHFIFSFHIEIITWALLFPSEKRTIGICLTFDPPLYFCYNFPRLNCIIHETFDSSSTGRNDISPQMCAVKVVSLHFPNGFFFLLWNGGVRVKKVWKGVRGSDFSWYPKR